MQKRTQLNINNLNCIIYCRYVLSVTLFPLIFYLWSTLRIAFKLITTSICFRWSIKYLKISCKITGTKNSVRNMRVFSFLKVFGSVNFPRLFSYQALDRIFQITIMIKIRTMEIVKKMEESPAEKRA